MYTNCSYGAYTVTNPNKDEVTLNSSFTITAGVRCVVFLLPYAAIKKIRSRDKKLDKEM